MKKRILHKLAHLLRINAGMPHALTNVETERIVMCFRCSGCGELQGCHYTNILPDLKERATKLGGNQPDQVKQKISQSIKEHWEERRRWSKEKAV